MSGERRREDRTPPPFLRETPDGTLHFSVPDFLDYYGYADTPENRQVAEETVREVFARQFPGVPIHAVEGGRLVD